MALFSRTVFRSYPTLLYRSFHSSYTMQDTDFNKFLYQLDRFPKYGLLADDLLTDLDADVKEAIRRLPEDEQMQRKYRAIRAQQAELNNSILPKSQWTKFEDNHYYLQPYLKEVIKEREEREHWEATH